MTRVDPPDQLTLIYGLLRRLGLNACQAGFFYTAHAVRLALGEPERLVRVTKQLYPDVALICGVSPGAVECGIRTAIRAAWKDQPAAVRALSAAPMDHRPPASRFIELLVAQLSPSGGQS